MSLPCKTKVCNLDSVGRRCGRWSYQCRISLESRSGVLRCRGRNQYVLWLDISVEEVVIVDVVEAAENLIQDAFDAAAIQAFMISGLHQLVQIAIHILHADVQFLGHRIQEDVESWHQMGVCRERP